MAITLGSNGYVTSGLVCYLDASKTASYPGTGTTWTDLSGTGNHGTLVAAPTVSNGKFQFNGTTQCITIPGFNFTTGAYTILAGAGYTGTSGSRLISSTTSATNWLICHGGNIGTYYAGGWISAPSLGAFDTVYRHWVATGTTGAYSLYANGTLMISNGNGTLGPNGITVGGWSQSGTLSEMSASQCGYIMAYNRVLSLAEIQQNYAYISQGITLSDGSVQGSAFNSSSDTGYLLATTVYSATGASTWTKPAGCTKVIVKIVGGGGGGCGHCESGGAGGYSEKVIDVTSVATVAVTVGGGGASIAYHNAAPNGGTSSFGSYCSATGGYGANQHAGHTGGHGGIGSSGDVNFLGGVGTGHSNNGAQQSPGRGGSSYWGGCSGQSHNNSNPSNIYYMAPGTGGTGGNQGGYGFRAGSSGLVVVYSYA